MKKGGYPFPAPRLCRGRRRIIARKNHFTGCRLRLAVPIAIGFKFFHSIRFVQCSINNKTCHLTARLFEGDVSALVSHLLTEQEIEPDELGRLRRLIASKEREENRDGGS